jgi:hypothetical protein
LPSHNILFGNKNYPSITATKISQALTGDGWIMSSTADKSEFKLKINASAQIAVEHAGVHKVFTDGSISLIRTASNDEIFATSMSQVSGTFRINSS